MVPPRDILSPMSHSHAIKCALITLLVLIFTTFAQMTTEDFPYTDEQVAVTPKTNWSFWSYKGSSACPGIWTGAPDGKHTISLNFTGVGIAVHGYAENPQQVPWKFQISDETPEVLSLEPNAECQAIKNRQGLENGEHRVVVTPLDKSFVLTKFTVTQNRRPPLSTGEIVGIVIGGISALLAVPGVYFGYKEWSRRKRNVEKV